jgi:hypothetical protein
MPFTYDATKPDLVDPQRRNFVFFGGVCLGGLLFIGGMALWIMGRISSLEFFCWIVAEVPICWLAGHAMWSIVERASSGFVKMIMSGGSTPPAYTFSEQQALVVQWRYSEAAASYRKYIDDNPGEIEGRLRLAELLAGPAQDPDGAEEMFLEARVLGGSPQQDATLSNGLIDLYTATGRAEGLRRELGRFARTYAGSGAAAKAAERLAAMDLVPTPPNPDVPH